MHPPRDMMRVELDVLRSGVVFDGSPRGTALRLSGPRAFEAVDTLVSSDLFLQDAQLRQSLLLRDDGTILADVLVGRDEDDFWLLVEGLEGENVAEHVAHHGGGEITVAPLRAAYDHVALHGPYAWELVAAFLGEELIGLPYLTSYKVKGALCLRSGKTGEYGYDLFLPHGDPSLSRAALLEAGARFDLAPISHAALAIAAFENGFFDIAREASIATTPYEAGLAWRASSRKAYVGGEALAAKRAELPNIPRCVTATGGGGVYPRDRIIVDDREIGVVTAAVYSPHLGAHLFEARIERPYAHAGLHHQVHSGATLTTVSPPLLANRSLFVSPQRHAWATRKELVLPPLVSSFE